MIASGRNRPGKAETDRLVALVYKDLRRIAGGYLRRERSDHTLQPTALINEAYLRLAEETRLQWQNRAHFVGVAARVMRRVLRDHARRRRAEKRTPGHGALLLEDTIGVSPQHGFDALDLERALDKLLHLDPELTRFVELRYFGGLTLEETAAEMELSTATVKRHWTVAKAFLCREIAP